MTKARILTTAGVIHITIATLLAMMALFGRPANATGAVLGFTPTSTESPPTDTPTETPPTATPPTITPTSPPPPPPACKLTITKTASPTEVLPGDQVTFVIRVCNEGNETCENVVVSDALPSELEVVSASASQGQAIVVGNGVRAEFGDLLPGACAELTIVARVRPDVPPCTQISNVATIGDLVSNRVVVTTTCYPPLLPESGEMTTHAILVGLLAVGVGLLTAGLALRGRELKKTSEDR